MKSAHIVLRPTSVAEAVTALGAGSVPLAGATWLMRARLRGEALAEGYVALAGVAGLGDVVIGEREIAIGAAVTHVRLGAALGALDNCRGLVEAALRAANPAVRNAATIGGNLCAQRFAASDLAPALIAAGAQVEICDALGARRLSTEALLAARADGAPGWLLTRILLPREDRIAAHARLTLRKAGDYPVAIVSVSLDRSGAAPRIAVGSVEALARRWTGLEQALAGQPLDAGVAADRARQAAEEFVGRDEVEAPGWYRTHVLPSLVRAAFQSLQARA